MNNTVSVETQNLLTAYNEASEECKQALEAIFGKDLFKPKSVMDRIKTFLDAAEEVVIPDNLRSLISYNGTDLLSAVSFAKMQIIAQALNEGWKPDWNNPNEIKYYPWFNLSNGFRFGGYDCYYRNCYVGSRLCFRSRELAEYAGKQFTELYKDFMTF